MIAVLLVAIAAVLLLGHDAARAGESSFEGVAPTAAGVVAGFTIGVVASLLGVAGGELLIPTLVLLFGADLKLAGGLSLVVSLPTIAVRFARYSRDRSFGVLGATVRSCWSSVPARSREASSAAGCSVWFPASCSCPCSP